MSKTKFVKNLSFLQKLKEKKEILFGKFCDTINREVKQEEWEELRQFCIAIGLITNDKDFIFVRNNTWGNLRKKTLKKIDAAKKTGGDGSPDQKLDELDLLVLDIIGRESPAVQGLGVPDSMCAGPKTPEFEDGGDDASTFSEHDEVEIPKGDLIEKPLKKRMEEIQQKAGENFSKFTKKRPVSAAQFHEFEELKKKKLTLEVENLAMDLFLKEVSCNMPPSKFTEHLHKKRTVEIVGLFEDESQHLNN